MEAQSQWFSLYTPSRTKRNIGGKHRSRATQLLTEDTIRNRSIYYNIRECFCRISKMSGVALRDLCWKHTNNLKVPWARKAKKLIQKVNVRTRSSVRCQSKNWTLEKKVLMSCFNMTHPISKLQAGQPTASTSYPEGGVLLTRPV